MTITSSPELTERAIRKLTDPCSWFGLSGHRVTGEAVARHLEAAARLMERDGWDPQLYARFSGRHLYDALYSTRDDGLGDTDTQFIAGTVLETLIKSVTGAPYVDYEVWSQHPTRTLDQILNACQVASNLARQYGPAST